MEMSAAWLVIFAGMLMGRGSALLLEEDCGDVVVIAERIVGGVDAGPNMNPWMALIKYENEFVCGGSLISDRFVLTAAHCICYDAQCSKLRTQLTATLGVYQSQATNEANSAHEQYNVIWAYVHRSFNSTSNHNDIALLKLERSVVYHEQIKPICILLDKQHKPQTDNITMYTAVGWGSTGNKNASDELQMTQIHKKNKTLCYNISWVELLDSQICAGTSGDNDTCSGDSGGPLYTKWLYGRIFRATQLGIISGGDSSCKGTGVYTDVMGHIDLIERTVLESDIKVVLPKIDLLDAGCLGGRKRTLSSNATRSFEWLAEVYMSSFLVSYGVLISKTYVLTTTQMLPENVKLKVQLGQGDVDIYAVIAVHRHPQFVSLAQNDIALLQLDKEVQYTESIRPICLPSPSNDAEQEKFRKRAADPAQKLITVGWGIRTHVAVRLKNSSECYQEDHQEIGERQLCVERPAHHILRLGSGSPLVSPLPHGNREAFSLVGLASFGRRQDFAPDVYTNVLGHLKWIGVSVTKNRIL